jgi:hypothetical protein
MQTEGGAVDRHVMQQTLDIGFAHDRTTGKEDWLTPPEIVRALGEFYLDPATPIVRPWDTAREHYNVMHDGLRQEWFGRVWLNPPYGDKTARWMERLATHGNGIALIFARTETAAFFPWAWGPRNGSAVPSRAAELLHEGRTARRHGWSTKRIDCLRASQRRCTGWLRAGWEDADVANRLLCRPRLNSSGISRSANGSFLGPYRVGAVLRSDVAALVNWVRSNLPQCPSFGLNFLAQLRAPFTLYLSAQRRARLCESADHGCQRPAAAALRH